MDQQFEFIQKYCDEHGYRVIKTFRDDGKVSFGLQEALESLNEADGLIAVDLNQFVQHPADRLRDLRPFIHHFFCHTAKHLITVKEGIDTGSPSGQISAIELINKSKEFR